MKRLNFEIGGTTFPGEPVIYVHPSLKFHGWIRDKNDDGDEVLVAGIKDCTVEISLDRIGELIHYLEEWNHERRKFD